MRIQFLMALCFATGMSAQEEPMELLRLVQGKVGDSLARIPRYMCTETIDRSLYQPDTLSRNMRCDEDREHKTTHLTTKDRLRMDVAMGTSLEMYSWVGESRFNDRDLLDMVREGAVSTGTFAAFLTAIFRTDSADFTYDGETTRNGRPVSEFGFRVPYERSRYFYGEGQQRVVTAYEGSFLVDRQTADLVRLVVRTEELPSETAACYASTTLDYARVQLRGTDFLLPSESLLRIVHTDGGVAENRSLFSGCHQFLGESTISFDPSDPTAGTEAELHPAPNPRVIPRGLKFRAALTQGIDTSTAAGGDFVKAMLITPIRDGKKVIVPEGAAIGARIVRIRRYYGKAAAVAVDVKLETIEIAGASVHLTAPPILATPLINRRAGACAGEWNWEASAVLKIDPQHLFSEMFPKVI